jgi:hypothetical protein
MRAAYKAETAKPHSLCVSVTDHSQKLTLALMNALRLQEFS